MESTSIILSALSRSTSLMTIIVIREETVIMEEAITMVEIITMGIINPRVRKAMWSVFGVRSSDITRGTVQKRRKNKATQARGTSLKWNVTRVRT